jgi:tetratricopeptide (TPR) repeat protein
MSRFGKLEFESSEHQDPLAVSVSRQDANHFLGDAAAKFFREEFEPALRSYARALEFNPRSLEAWSGQVRALIELGEFHEAKVWAEKALERFPNAGELLAAKAVALGRLGDTETALALSDASLEAKGDDAYLWIARADVLLAREEKRALYCVDRAREIAPHDWSVCWLAGRALRYWKQLAAALKMAQQAISLDSGQVGAWLLCCECQLALGFAAPSRVSAQQILSLAPDLEKARELLRRSENVGWGVRVAALWRRWTHHGGDH